MGEQPARPPTTPLSVHAALIFVQVTFGSWAVFGKFALRSLDPFVLADLRVLGAVPVFFTAALARERRLPPPRDLLLLATLGFFGVFANQLLYIAGLGRTTATNASILQAATPVFTAAVAALLAIERLRGARLAGVALAVGGAVVMLDPSRFDASSDMTTGNLLILGNSFCYATYVVLQRNIVRRMSPLSTAAWAYLFGGIGVAIVTTPTLLASDLSSVDTQTWWAVAYIIAIPTILNYALIAWSLRWSSPALVATYTALQPVVAALLATTLLGERAGLREALGFLSIVAGLFAVSRASPAPTP